MKYKLNMGKGVLTGTAEIVDEKEIVMVAFVADNAKKFLVREIAFMKRLTVLLNQDEKRKEATAKKAKASKKQI